MSDAKPEEGALVVCGVFQRMNSETGDLYDLCGLPLPCPRHGSFSSVDKPFENLTRPAVANPAPLDALRLVRMARDVADNLWKHALFYDADGEVTGCKVCVATMGNEHESWCPLPMVGVLSETARAAEGTPPASRGEGEAAPLSAWASEAVTLMCNILGKGMDPDWTPDSHTVELVAETLRQIAAGGEPVLTPSATPAEGKPAVGAAASQCACGQPFNSDGSCRNEFCGIEDAPAVGAEGAEGTPAAQEGGGADARAVGTDRPSVTPGAVVEAAAAPAQCEVCLRPVWTSIFRVKAEDFCTRTAPWVVQSGVDLEECYQLAVARLRAENAALRRANEVADALAQNELAQRTKELEALRVERDEALAVLAPSMPESGLADAARQAKQVAISEGDNSAALEQKLAEANGKIEALVSESAGLIQAEFEKGEAHRARADALAKELAEARAEVEKLRGGISR